MTKKDYELIAKVVATIIDDDTRWATADAFAKVLRADNPGFRPVTFWQACKVWDQLGKKKVSHG